MADFRFIAPDNFLWRRLFFATFSFQYVSKKQTVLMAFSHMSFRGSYMSISIAWTKSNSARVNFPEQTFHYDGKPVLISYSQFHVFNPLFEIIANIFTSVDSPILFNCAWLSQSK